MVSPMLYKLTVFGEVHSTDAAMTSLTELFQKHIVTISKVTMFPTTVDTFTFMCIVKINEQMVLSASIGEKINKRLHF